MTLREGLQELTEQLREQGKMVVLLDAILAQTAADDAEVARLAEVGRVMHELLNPFTRDNDFAQVALYFNGVDAYCCWQEDDEGGVINRVEGDTLLDALRELAKKVEVK